MRFGVLFLFLAGSGALMAQAPGVNVDFAVPGPHALKDFLALSDDQIGQLNDLRRQRREQTGTRMKQLHEKRRQLEEELNTSAPDPAKVGQLMVEIRQAETEIPEDRERQREQALSILSSDQRAKLERLSEALELMHPAHEAVALNLIGEPGPAGDIHMPGPGGHHGRYWVGAAPAKAVFMRHEAPGNHTERIEIRRLPEATP